jgi:hypothetical protein
MLRHLEGPVAELPVCIDGIYPALSGSSIHFFEGVIPLVSISDRSASVFS